MAFSVCIISNVAGEVLSRVVESYRMVSDDIHIGFNGLLAATVADFVRQHPYIKAHLLEWNGYGPTKNALADRAAHDWILSVDSDEIASPELQAQLAAFSPTNSHTVYCLQLQHRIGKERIRYGTFGTHIELKRRLYHRAAVRWDTEQVHEALIFPADVQFQTLEGILYHHTADSIADMRQKNRNYARLSALNMKAKGKRYPAIRPYSSAAMALIKQYVLKKGFLDGRIGWQLALEQARYAWLKYRLLEALYRQAAT